MSVRSWQVFPPPMPPSMWLCLGQLRADLAAQGCTVHTPPQQGMLNPPPWDKAIYAQRHAVENLVSRLRDAARIALRRDKTRRSWMGFVYLAAAIINLRLSRFSHTA